MLNVLQSFNSPNIHEVLPFIDIDALFFFSVDSSGSLKIENDVFHL